MKIVYTIAGTYRAAGMERVLANKSNALCEAGHDILIVTTEQRGRSNAFDFDSRIRFMDLNIGYESNNGGSFLNKVLNYPFKQIKHRLKLSKLLKKERADIVISMFCNDASFIPKIKDGSKKVLEIHFSRYKRLQYGRIGIWALADKLRTMNDARLVSRFDKFVVLTDEDRGYWGELDNIQVIPNARTFTLPEPASLDEKVVIAVGRYNFQKDLTNLLDAWNLVEKDGWKLWLVGDGEDRPILESKIKALNMQDSVVLGKATCDIREVYKHASLLVMSSRYEGLPMVLLEAQAAGLPIVSYACKCGPRDVITNGVDGFLVEQGDVEELARKMSIVMQDDSVRKRMGAAAYKASDRFDECLIMLKWEQLFKELS